MIKRRTIQKDLVFQAVNELHGHVTADEVYEFIREKHPSVSKGTVYRNLNQLAQDGEIRRVEIPDGPDCFDFTTRVHYHVCCVLCHRVFDVDMDEIPDLMQRIRDTHGVEFLKYDILFKGICPDCRNKSENKEN